MAKKFTIFKSYHFRGQDPIVADVKDLVKEEAADRGISEKAMWGKACDLSGVSRSATSNWRKGVTYRPQFATLNAIARTMDRELRLVPKGRNR